MRKESKNFTKNFQSLKRRDVETKLNRIFRLLYRLMSGSTVESSKLAEEFGVSIRTVERYIEELRMAGVPITSSQGRHKMAKSMLDIDYDYTLSLTAREKKILLLMIVLAKNYFGSLYSKDLQNIESQIINSLSLDSFYSKYAYYVQCYSFLQPKVEEVDIRVVEAIEEAIANHVVIQFNYHHPERRWQKYTVEPYRIVFSDEHWYLFCRDVERNFKLFLRLSRIHVPVISTERSFSMPTRQEIDTMLSKVWGTHFSVERVRDKDLVFQKGRQKDRRNYEAFLTEVGIQRRWFRRVPRQSLWLQRTHILGSIVGKRREDTGSRMDQKKV